jgi:putative ATP-dependent endonuclease of OLD family
MVKRLTEHDFFGSDPDEKSRIVIIATITDFAGNDPSYHPAWFGAARGVEKWLDTESGELHSSRSDPTWSLAVQVGFAARFDLEDLEADTIRFFVDDEGALGDPFSEDARVVQVPAATLQELGFFLVPASRTWDRWISFSSELFKRLFPRSAPYPPVRFGKERSPMGASRRSAT